jgi:hypothetical protein
LDVQFNGQDVFKMNRKGKKVCHLNSEGKLVLTFNGVIYNGYGTAFYVADELPLRLSKNSVHYVKIAAKGGFSIIFYELTEEEGKKEFTKKKYTDTYAYIEPSANYFNLVAYTKGKSSQTVTQAHFLMVGWRDKVFDKSLQYVNVNYKDGSGAYKGQILKNNLGTGITQYAYGTIIIGDWQNNKPNGYGMAFNSDGVEVTNCPNCQIYVGNRENGQKSGIGTCYDKNGNLIYHGNFKDDKPIETYPTENVQNDYSSYKFSFYTWENGDMYLGETKNGLADGYGIYVWANGNIWFGGYKDDKRKGAGIFITYNAEWETGSWYGDNYAVISSSSANAERANLNRQAKAQAFSQAAGAISAGMNQITTQIQNSTNNSNSNSNLNTSTSGSSTKSNRNTSTEKSSMPDCGDNWRTDSRTYSWYDDELVKMQTYPERYDNYASHVSEIQSKMRHIRQKWEAKGCKITKSPRE